MALGSHFMQTERGVLFILSETQVHLNLCCVMTKFQKIRELEALDKTRSSRKDAAASERNESSAEQMRQQNVERDSCGDAD